MCLISLAGSFSAMCCLQYPQCLPSILNLQYVDAYPLCYDAVELVHDLACLSLLYVCCMFQASKMWALILVIYCFAALFCVPQDFSQLVKACFDAECSADLYPMAVSEQLAGCYACGQ